MSITGLPVSFKKMVKKIVPSTPLMVRTCSNEPPSLSWRIRTSCPLNKVMPTKIKRIPRLLSDAIITHPNATNKNNANQYDRHLG